MKYFPLLLFLCACQQTGNAPKLQSHLQGATVAGQQTAGHIANTRNSIERIEYKDSQAQRLLNEGFAK
jgi:hypothetical protein